jgi:predicted transcriptional regulator
VSEEKKTKVILIRVSDTFKKKVDATAKKNKTDAAKLVRDAIEEKLDKEK